MQSRHFNIQFKTVVMVTLGFSAAASHAATWPQTPMPMHHIAVSFDGTSVDAHLEAGSPDPLPLYNYGESYTSPADVLDGKAYNDQYGFNPSGFITPPVGANLWFSLVSKTSGLDIYEGGMRMMKANHSYAPILSSPGDTWSWNGNMVHHWFAATTPGDYSATFEIYIGDSNTGEALNGYEQGEISLDFSYVPEPSAACMFLFAGMAALRRFRFHR